MGTANTDKPGVLLAFVSQTRSPKPLCLEAGFREETTQQWIKINYQSHACHVQLSCENQFLQDCFLPSWKGHGDDLEKENVAPIFHKCQSLQDLEVSAGDVIHLEFIKAFKTNPTQNYCIQVGILLFISMNNQMGGMIRLRGLWSIGRNLPGGQ